MEENNHISCNIEVCSLESKYSLSVECDTEKLLRFLADVGTDNWKVNDIVDLENSDDGDVKTYSEQESQSFDKEPDYNPGKEAVEEYEPVIGERVIHSKYGNGVIKDIIYDENEYPIRFMVDFDDGLNKVFGFPAAFDLGMCLENGTKVEPKKKVLPSIPRVVDSSNDIKENRSNRSQINHKSKKSKYAYWSQRYPDYVVIKKEVAFWTCRGDSAETVSSILGYRLGNNMGNTLTGSPVLEPITAALKYNKISYIVVEDEEIILKEDF